MGNLDKSISIIKDYYAIKPGAPFFQKEFGFYSLERWQKEGYLKKPDEVEDYNRYLAEIFSFDEPCIHNLWGNGWCEAELMPQFEVKILEDRGSHELVQDFVGRGVLYFKGRRSGFMPEYITFPVKDMQTLEENITWRMNPNDTLRRAENEKAGAAVAAAAEKGMFITQRVVGGYMYLRSLIGPEALFYMFYDDPELIHRCMKIWFELADTVTARHQKYVSFDELFLGEDICYNHGSFISPEMMREFLLPYYTQLFENIKKRQIDKSKKLHFQIDTDGFCDPVIDIYRGIGVNSMSPFEVASDCDVLRTGRKYPELLLSGGVDKRVLNTDAETIDRYLDGFMPAMYNRGGYIPTCDHGVPEEVSFENYLHFRKRMLEYAK